MRTRVLVVGAMAAAVCLAGSGPAEARNLRRTLGQPTEDQGGVLAAALAPLGSVIGAQLANQIPSVSTSAGFTYEFNKELDVYERSTKTFGPLFSERADTVGAQKFNINVSYTYVRFNEYNGHDLDDLTSRVETGTVNGQRAFAGLRRPDLASNFPGLTGDTTFTEVNVDLDLEAQLLDFSFTYGVLDNLDVNIDIPVLRTFARSTVTERTLDPRFVAFASLDPTTLPEFVDEFAARESAFGIGDIRLRSKYRMLTTPIRLAGLLDLVLPTGSPGNFQGTGDTRLGTYLIFSQTVADIFEPHAQAGVEFNCDNVDHSQARYLVGLTAQVASFAALTVDFLGRSEFAPAARIPGTARLPAVRNDGEFAETQPTDTGFHGRPVLININRNDVLDLAVGGKVSIAPQMILFATATIPMNDDGLRASVVPTVGFEATF
jgi:hypothetical protein